MPSVRTIATTTHGRYLVDAPAGGAATGLLIGFHGYAEGADAQFERLRSIPGAEHWIRVAVQGLHRFYRGRSQEVVAGWMTREDRELMIADNLAYVAAVTADVLTDRAAPRVAVFAGFSQGVAMAYRAACASPLTAAVIALGGDIPPELERSALSSLAAVLIGRGNRDEWYTAAKFGEDAARVRQAGTVLHDIALDAAHEWTADFSIAAGRLLAALS
jgi:predicted esterase